MNKEQNHMYITIGCCASFLNP